LLDSNIEQSRAELAAFVKAQGSRPSADQKLEIMKRREKLSKRLEEFSEAGQGHFPNLEINEGTIHDPPLSEDIVDDDDWSDCDEEETPAPSIPSLPDQGYGSAEHQQILIPSSFQAALLPTSLGEARCVEIELRVAQANNALKRLREAIGYKSFLYRKRIRAEKSKKRVTRAYDAVQGSDRDMKSALRAYNQARWALNQLNAPRGTRDRYKPIGKKDTRALTTVYDGNARGQRNIALPWFWNMAVADDSSGSTYMEQGQIQSLLLLCMN
jgi:hypothetical protein